MITSFLGFDTHTPFTPRELVAPLLGSAELCFPSDYDLATSVTRLSARVQRPSWNAWLLNGLFGVITPKRVVITNYDSDRLFFRYPRLHFKGRFTESNGKVELRGRLFAPAPFRVFTAVWFGLAAYFFLLPASYHDWLFLSLLVVLAVLICWLGWRAGLVETSRLRHAVATALSASSSGGVSGRA